MTDIDIIIEAQTAQIAKPARALVNSECAFVSDKITHSYNRPELAKEYWRWVCSEARHGSLQYGQEVLDQYNTLRKIDAGQTMPEWGYKGT